MIKEGGTKIFTVLDQKMLISCYMFAETPIHQCAKKSFSCSLKTTFSKEVHR